MLWRFMYVLLVSRRSSTALDLGASVQTHRKLVDCSKFKTAAALVTSEASRWNSEEEKRLIVKYLCKYDEDNFKEPVHV